MAGNALDQLLADPQKSAWLRDLLSNPDAENMGVAQRSMDIPQPQAPMQNWVQRGNNAPIDLGQSQGMPPPQNNLSQLLRPQLDYSQAPVDMGGQKGYRVKGDPFTAIMADGTKISMGNDYAATRARQMQDLQMAEAKQKLEGDTADTKIKQMQIAQGGKGIVPAGYRATANGNMEAIPGGPADLKLAGQYNADTAQLNGSISGMDRLAVAANEALNHPGLAGTAGLRGVIPNIPGSDAANAAALLNTLKSQVAFSVLQDMRNNSKTGGALGNVSDKEGQLLQSNLAALEKSQSVEQLQSNLKKIIDYTGGAKERLGAAFNMRHGQNALGNPSTGAPTAIFGQPAAQTQPASSIPPDAAQMLKTNPNLRSAFDAKYGVGASAQILGR